MNKKKHKPASTSEVITAGILINGKPIPSKAKEAQ